MLTVLLDGGCDVNATDSVGGTPLLACVSEADTECVKLLLARGADKNAKVTIAAYGSETAIAVDVTVREDVPRVILRDLKIVSGGAESIAPSYKEALIDTAAVDSGEALYVVGGEVMVDSCEITGRVFVSGAICTLRDSLDILAANVNSKSFST